MLSRTAENLFWSARYIERADSLARLLEVGYRISLIPNTERGYTNEWESILETSGIKNEYLKKLSDWGFKINPYNRLIKGIKNLMLNYYELEKKKKRY